jgi:hypothetical protein
MSIDILGHLVDRLTKVSFTTVNTYDSNVYIGVIEAIATKSMASIISDVDGYQDQVLKSIDIGAPENANIVNLDDSTPFIIIRTSDDGDVSKRVAIAVPWIASLEVLTATKFVDFRVFGITDAAVGPILQLLTAAGYKAKPTPK